MMLRMTMWRWRTDPKTVAHTCAVKMHLDTAHEPSYARIYRENVPPQMENVAPQVDLETMTHTLCEPAQSKCTWTCQKSQLAQEFTRKIPRPRCIPRPRPTLCASLRRRNAHGRVTRAILRGNLQGKCRALGARQREPAQSTRGHVTRAILCRNLQVKGRRPRASKSRGADFARACAIDMHMDMEQG